MLITPIQPEQASGKIILGKHRIDYSPNDLRIEVEPISGLLDPLLKKIWGDEMYRIVMTVTSQATKGRVTYRIR